MLAWLKTFGAVGLGWMYFACEKDMSIGRPEGEIDWAVFPCHPTPNQYVEDLIPSVTVFGNSFYKEVIRVKWGHKDGALIQWDWCPYKKRNTRCLSLSLSLSLLPPQPFLPPNPPTFVPQRESHVRIAQEAVGKPGREISPGT